MTSSPDIEEMLRELAPQVLAGLLRRHRDFHTCEDSVQEALLAASVQWVADGVPGNPRGWLVTVASRRYIELWRQEGARRRREETVATLEPGGPSLSGLLCKWGGTVIGV